MNDMPVFGPDQVSTKTALEDIAIETGTPIEVLFAAGEQAGAKSPDEFLNIARQRGQALGPRFKAGEDPTAIVTELFGEEAQRSFADYATEIRAQLYGTPTVQQRNQAELDNEGIGGLLKRRGQQFIRGATEPFASLPEAKAIAQAQTDGEATPAAEIEGFERGQQMRDSVADRFGAPNPEDRSFWGMVAEGAGNLVGMGGASLAAGAAGALVGGPAAPITGAAAGIATGAGIGASMNTSQLYRDAREAGAEEAVAEQAARWGALIGASEIVPIARAFKYLPQGVRSKIGNGMMKRFADIAQSAGEEAAQEYLATVANNIVAQQLYDPERGWTDDATEAALVGAVLGAGAGSIGAGVDAYRNRQQPQPLPEAGPDQGAAPPGADPVSGPVPPVAAPPSEPEQVVPTPTTDMLRPQAVDPIAPAAPAPISEALGSAPAPMFGSVQEGDPVSIQFVDPETGELSDPVPATFVGEDPAQGYASFRDATGAAGEIDLAEIASGSIVITPTGAPVSVAPATQAPAGEAIPAAQPEAAQMPAIPQGVDPDLFMERVAIRQADGMTPDEAYQMTLQDALDTVREDVGAIADDVESRQRQASEEQSRIDEAVFTDERGQPVIFPTEKTALGRLGAGYSVEPFGEGFIGVRQQEVVGNEGDADDRLGGDGDIADGGTDIVDRGDDDRAPAESGRDSLPVGPAAQGTQEGVADAADAPDADSALKEPSDQKPINKNDEADQSVTQDQPEVAKVDQETDPIRAATTGAPADVDYPNRKLNMRKARVDAPIDGMGDSSDMSFGNIALSNAREGDVLPGVGTVLKVTDKQIQINKPDGGVIRLSDGEKLNRLARDMGSLIASSANLRDEQLGSLMGMIERDPTLTYRDGAPMLFDDPAQQANRGQRSQRGGILRPLTPTRQEVEQADQETDPIRAAVRDAITAGPVQHTTAKGKVLDGYIIKGMKPAQVKEAFDTGAFSKDGGTFIRKDRADNFMGQGTPAKDSATDRWASIASATITPENKDGDLGDFTASSANALVLPTGDGDASIQITSYKPVVIRGARGTEEKSKKLKYSEVRDQLTPAARAEVERLIAQDAAESQAATVAEAAAQADPEPTEGQKEAGNYKLGHARWNGLNLSIENEKGSTRSKKTPDGKTEWSVTMPAHYGYFRQTKGADGDHVDFYMGDAEGSDYVMWIDQADADTGKFDEHKIMIGFTARGAALEAYRAGFSDGRANDRIGNFFEGDVAQLKAWLESTSDSNFDSAKPVNGAMTFPFKKAAAPKAEPVDPFVAAGFTIPKDATARVLEGKRGEQSGRWVVRPLPGEAGWRVLRFTDDVGTVSIPSREVGRFGTPEEAIAAVKADGEKAGAKPKAEPKVGDRVLVKFDSPTREERMTVIKGPFNTDAQGRSYQVMGDGTGAVNVRADRVRLAPMFKDDAAAKPESNEGPRLTTREQGRAAGGAWAEQGKPETMRDDPAMGNASGDAQGGWIAGYRAAKKPTPAPEPTGWRSNKHLSLFKRVYAEPNNTLEDMRNGMFPEVAEYADWLGSLTDAQLDAIAPQFRADYNPFHGATYLGNGGIADARAEFDPLLAALEPQPAPAPKPRPAPQPTPKPEPEAKPAPVKQSLSSLSKQDQDRAAFLRARIADRLKNQTNMGVDPAILQDAIELTGLYIKDGYRKFRALLDQVAADMGMTAKEAEPWVRAGYTQARDNLEIEGQDVSDMDSSAEVVAAVRALRAETDPTPSGELPQEAPSDTNEGAGEGAADEQRGNQESDQGEPASESPQEGVDAEGQPDSEPADDGRGEGDENGEGEPAGDESSAGLGDGPGSVSDRPIDARRGEPSPNFVIADDFPLGEGSEGQKLAANMEALRLVRALEAENRYATPEEQAVLARWVGWGGLKTVFDGKHKGTTSQWGRAQAELKELLTTQEYIAAMRSTNDAHYTSRTVVKAMWRAMRNFGFDGGRALEPTIGSGNFLGLQPADLSAKTEWFAAELDPLTGMIAKHLYPQARVFDGMGFQDAPFKRAAFDVAIGNPPFGGTQIGNKDLHPDLGKMKVHNFIIAKTGQLLREGGVMSMVVTHRFLDTPNPEARKALAPDFRFLGAVRLPNTAFEANANTNVVTDIVFFQKRREGETDNDTIWLETGVAGPNGTTLNGYFAANPDMILGRAAMDGTMYAGGRKKDGPGEFTVHPDDRDLEQSLNEAIDRIEATIPTREQSLEDATTARENSSTLAYGDLMLAKDGRIFRGEEDEAGNRIVQEVTADSFWKDNAEAQGRVVATLRDALDRTKTADIEQRMDLQQQARDAALEAGLIDLAGDPVKLTTKYEQALADSHSNLLYADKPQKESLAALDAYEKQVDAKRLGTDGFQRLSAILDLRQKTRELISLERADAEGEKIEAKRRVLRRTYRAFQKKHGFINNSKNEAIMRGDVGPEFALEVKYKAANKEGRAEEAKEAPILEKRVIYPHKIPDSVESVADGLHVSMQERGFIDPVLIGALTGKSTEDVVAEMTSGNEPLAFRNPKSGKFESAEIYLSGNLAEKITAAENAGMYQNVPHLKNAMPPPKEKEQITPSIRSLWMPTEIFTDFLRALGYSTPAVNLMETVGMASIDPGSTAGLTDFGRQFETERMDPGEIFEHAVKGKIPVVYDSVRNPDGGYRQVKNEPATREAVTAYERMSREFPQWAYANPERAGKIVDAFNKKMNVVTERKYQGVRYLRMVGNSPEISLRNSQKNGAWRMIQDKVTLLHHVVGAGKTFTAIAGIMERKRMGLTRKAVVAVPNHLTGQWGREWLELYPAANILVPTEKDFEPANRAKLINRIATGDFDAVIIGHSQLTKIENDPQTTEQYISEQIDELNAVLQEQRDRGESRRTVGQIGTRLTKLNDKLTSLREKLAERSDDSVIGWKELGVDYLTVDEAHLFKNLEYSTSASQLVGMNPPAGSQRAFDLLMKVRTLQDMQSGGVAFLTGTPVSNSLVEIYSMMKYLIPESLHSMGVNSFDAWKAAFIQDESRFEYTASMQLKERNVMSGMINLGPLSQVYRSFADIVMRPDVERMYQEEKEAKNAAEPDPSKHESTRFPTPKIKGGARRINLAPPTERMKEFVRYLVMRMAGIMKNKGKKEYLPVDNPLWVLTDARKASVDIRTIDPTLGREEKSKVDRASSEVFRIWEENTYRKGAQMVFSDMSAPTKNAMKDANRILKVAYDKIGLKKQALKDRIAADGAKTYAARWGDLIEEIENITSSPETDDKKRDSLNEFIESPEAQDAAGAMFTADNGFSFYDDMRAALIEKGIPAKEIAFIHDYDTTIKKAQLFDAVNEGNIRVLLGSTQKMGAGTNAQKRLVALHHIDAPWRPSDMEQREGRIIRQGNLFYEQDPDGFEVEIVAYSTEQTADVVQWQVLERKASSIETFMNATADNLVEEGGDADQYAEFMAQSTGKEVFLQKMVAQKELDVAQATIASTIRNLSEADRFIESYEQNRQYYGTLSESFASFSTDLLGDGADTYLSEWEGSVAAYRAERDRVEAQKEEIRALNATLPAKDRQKLPENPTAPTRWTERPASGWERKVYDALSEAQAQEKDKQIYIGISDVLALEISHRKNVAGSTTFYVYLTAKTRGGRTVRTPLIDNGAEVKNFQNSDKLVYAFSPANIENKAKGESQYYASAKQRLEETLPEMRAIKDRGVDLSGVNQAREKLARLTALVRIEEVKFASEVADAGANHFADRDDKGRDLIADDSAKPVTGDFEFTNAGQTYRSQWGALNGTRRIEGTDRTGAIVIFEGENAETGEPVILEVQQTQQQTPESDEQWLVLNVWDGEPEPAPKPKTDEEMRLEDDGGPAAAEMRGDTVGADPAFTEDAARAVTRRLSQEVAKALPDAKVSVRLVRDLYSLKDGKPIMGRANPDGSIEISARAARNADGAVGILNHEIIHVLRNPDLWRGSDGLFRGREWSRLVAAAEANPDLVAAVNANYDGKGLTREQMQEEYVAEMYRGWKAQTGDYGAVERILLKIEEFFKALASAFRGAGFDSAGRIMQRIADGTIGGRGPDGPGRGTQPRVSGAIPAEMRLGGKLDPIAYPSVVASLSKLWSSKPATSEAALNTKEGNFVSNLLTNAMGSNDRYNILGLVPGEVLFRDMGKNLPSAGKWVSTMRQMSAERQEMHAEADVLAREWQGAYAKDKANGRALHDLMHESTIEQVDPSERFRAPRRPVDMTDAQYMNYVEDKRAKHSDLQRKFNALPENMQSLYGKARDAYKAFDAKLIDAMVDAVVKAMNLQADRLKARYEAELQQFRDDGLEGDALREARQKARSRFNQDVKMLEFSRNARIRKMRLTYEANRIEGPYFPLMRFGQFFVAARDGKGKLIHFERASTSGVMNRIEAEMKDAGFVVEKGVMKPEDNMSRFVDPNFVADITEAMGEAGADSQILDAIYQRYLETLPSFSIRKANIHRQGVPGFDRDAIKAFGNRMFHGAHQLTRLRHSMDLTKHIENARREAKRDRDPVRAGALVNEMQKRHDWSMNPQGAGWSAWATSAAFVWYLGLTPGSAIVNLTQTTVVGIPMLAAGIKGGTVAKAAKHLSGALADFTAGLKKGDAEWSRGALTSGRLSDDERAALQAAYNSGALDKSQAHDIAAIGDSGVEYSAVREKAMRPIAFLFHHAERLNREVTFLAAYRMAKEAGMDAEAAQVKAGNLTWDTHFNYENWSRPRFMQGDVARVAFVFRQFQVNMLYRLFRDSHQALKGESPEVRKQARAQLIGITASMMAHAGITGTWGYALIMLLAGMFMEGGSDEAEEELKNAIVSTFGTGAGGLLLKGVPGHLTGIDLTSRIGMPELWFRSPNRQVEGQEAYNYIVEQMLGAVPAIGLNMLRGVELANDGEVWKGVELMVPKAIRDQLRFMRYLNEGVTTRRGDPLMDDISAHDAIVQSLGFSPARISERYEQNRRMMNAQVRIEDERRKILTDITRYISEGKEISARALRRRDEFNQKYPTYAITRETIQRSYKARQRMSEQMDGGVRLNPKLDRYLRESMAPSITD